MSHKSTQELSDVGYALLEQGRYPEALDKLNQALAAAPGNASILYRIGLVHLDCARIGEAIAAFDCALVIDPANARAHNNRGSCLEMRGQTDAARAAYQRALDLDNKLAQPYVNLGHLLEMQNKKPEAIELYRLAIKRGLDATLFGHHLAAISGEVTDSAHENWVRATFDNFAPGFDAHLQQLSYNAPEKLGAMLRARASAPLDMLDLGCGTGLSGLALTGLKGTLTGVDLSEKMLIRARERGIYDILFEGEIHAWIRGAATAQFDVVIAADVFIYFGRLDKIFTEAARLLRPGGWFTFSTEECEGADYKLLPTGRYKQSQNYIQRLAGKAFFVEVAEAVTIRLEVGIPVAGRLYLLRKREDCSLFD